MKNERDIAANSDIYALVEQVPMDSSQRVRALERLRSADAFVNGIVWVTNGIKHLLDKSEPNSKNDQKLAA
jgi:hypothetical protein